VRPAISSSNIHSSPIMMKTTAQTIEESIKTLIVGTCILNAEATEFVPPPPGFSTWSLNEKSNGLNADANEFVPAQTTATEMAPSGSKSDISLWYKKESNSHKGKFYYVHSKTGKTSWTLPEDYVEPIVQSGQAAPACKQVCLQSVSAINLAYLSDDSSDDDDTDQDDTPCLLMGKQARQRSLSPTASTTAGLSSDDEIDIADTRADEELPEACLGGQTFRPPPGLTLQSPPSHLVRGIFARAGLSVWTGEQHEHQQKKLPPWRSTKTSKFSSSVSESTAWTPPWRRETRCLVAAA